MQFKSPLLTFGSSHEKILKPRIVSIFVKGQRNRPASPLVRRRLSGAPGKLLVLEEAILAYVSPS